MAARTPRRSFAAPFVVTLAAVPACYVQSGPVQNPPPGPPPAQTAGPAPQQPGPVMANPPPPSTNQPPQQQPQRPPVVIANPPPPSTNQPSTPPQTPPVVIANPPPPRPTRPDPRPTAPTTKPTRPDPRPTAPTTTPAQTSAARWTVYRTKDGSCMAAIKVECQPKATCNPPPPFSYACPTGVSLEKPITVATFDGTSCFVEYDAPACPPKTACNPPHPRPVACPKR